MFNSRFSQASHSPRLLTFLASMVTCIVGTTKGSNCTQWLETFFNIPVVTTMKFRHRLLTRSTTVLDMWKPAMNSLGISSANILSEVFELNMHMQMFDPECPQAERNRQSKVIICLHFVSFIPKWKALSGPLNFVCIGHYTSAQNASELHWNCSTICEKIWKCVDTCFSFTIYDPAITWCFSVSAQMNKCLDALVVTHYESSPRGFVDGMKLSQSDAVITRFDIIPNNYNVILK